jgi:glycosyltransferase involved in cell wall biosynthesis
MRLSIYTCAKDAIFLDYHVVEMLRHHLPLADEIVVNEGYSSDDTYERIRDLDPKIRVFRSDWGRRRGRLDWFTNFKNEARRRCTGDWCLLLDCDEFIPEWEFDRVRKLLETTDRTLVPATLVNFYGNYKVYHREPEKVGWPHYKMIAHRNLPEVHVWGDGANVRIRDEPLDWECPEGAITVHHFGSVRRPARLRQKWSFLGALYPGRRRWFELPAFLFNWRPHDWMDPQFLNDLALYEGLYVQAVRDNPDEFVRDDFLMYDFLKKKTATAC